MSSPASLSPVAGTAAADQSLPSITSDWWVVQAENSSQKAELFAYATKAKIKTLNACPDHGDLSIGFYLTGLVAYKHDFNEDGSSWNDQYQVVSPAQFKAMCDAYATRPA